MKKLLIIIILLFLIVPVSANAFSFSNIFSFFKKEKIEIEIEIEPEPFIIEYAEEKYKAWTKAFKNKDTELVLANKDNLYFSEWELNYLIQKRLKDIKHPPAENVKIFLKDNLIKVKGKSLARFFKGEFELDIKPVKKGKRVVLEVKRTRFQRIYFPSFIASIMLKKEMDDTMNFLYSHGGVEELEIIVEEDNLELRYE